MQSSDSGRNISLTSYDDIFSTDKTRADSFKEKIVEIPLSELHPFKNHPFRVIDDDHMRETAESIRDYGVLVPAIVRPRSEGGYEIISGHRRKRASELAGKETMPVIIRDLDDDAAVIIMVDSNLQRESIFPSEWAFALKMKNEAMKHQGERRDLTSRQLVGKFESTEIIGQSIGFSGRQVQRFICLTNLIPPLLELVDSKKIAFNPAVELSHLTKDEQERLRDVIAMQQSTPSLSQAQRMKKYSQEGKLTTDVMKTIMSEVKKPEKESRQEQDAPRPLSPVPATLQDASKEENVLFADGFIKLPIEPFLKYLPKSLFQNPTPENQDKLTRMFLRMAELYKRWKTKKREQQI